MKKTVIASLAVIGCAAIAATLALGGGPKLNAIFEAKAASKSFAFDAATGSQFDDTVTGVQEVYVTTGSSSPIWTKFTPRRIGLLAFGEGGRFVEAHPNGDALGSSYTLEIGINNLTHFAIDVGVENDGGGVECEDTYNIGLFDEDGGIVKFSSSAFELDGSGNGTKHFEWEKGVNDSAVVGVNVTLFFSEDSADTSLYVSSLSLTWEC